MHIKPVSHAIGAVPRWSVRALARLLSAGLLVILAPQVRAEDPDPSRSYFIPQAGSVAYPLEGQAAMKFFRACPNNDGVSSLPNNARIQITLVGGSGPVSGYPASRIYVLFNGGTATQGFTGPGTDSVIANGTWNQNPLCPDVRRLTADAPTDAGGRTYITFEGISPTPGVGQRDPARKWGHYDSDIPVFVELSAGAERIPRRLAPGDPADAQFLHIKNFDETGGLAATMNQGEAVTTADFNTIVAKIGRADDLTYWVDFDSNGWVDSADFNMLVHHLNHNCRTPRNP